MIQLIVCDLDGTLINSDLVGHDLTDDVIKMVEVLKQNNIYFTIATGRETLAAKPLADKLKLNCPFITFNGAQLVSPEGTSIYSSKVDLSKWLHVIKKVDEIGGQVVVCETDKAYALRKSPRIKVFEDKQQITCEKIELKDISNIETSKLLLLGDIKRFRAIINEDDFLRENYEQIQSEEDYLEIVNKGINKGIMVEKLKQELNITGKVLALGNHMNDLEMLQVADIGVAVGNATEALKSCADVVTHGEYHEGVIEAIKKYVFKPITA